MKAVTRVRFLFGILMLGLGIGCSTLNEDHPEPMTEKCETCHYLPPQDSGKAWEEDTAVKVGIHYQHVTTEALTCNRCHLNFDTTTGWNVLTDHRTDTIRYDTSRCVLCHKYSDCNNPECHQSPPTSPSLLRKHHVPHVSKMGYKCHICHKGYDLERKIIPEDLHDNGIHDVIFDLRLDNTTLPVDLLGAPAYNAGTCNFVYCHGTTIVGGKKAITLGTAMDTVGSGRCNFCHDTLLLAATVDHSRPGTDGKKGHVDHFKDGCLICHKNYDLEAGIVNSSLHINGKKDLADCTKCHTDGVPPPFGVDINGEIKRMQ